MVQQKTLETLSSTRDIMYCMCGLVEQWLQRRISDRKVAGLSLSRPAAR